jgi:ASC-1-like (ASCH) protein
MQYTFHLKPHYFANMKEGSKRLELRLNDEKRRLLKIWDTIEFTIDSGEKLVARIVDLLPYPDFASLVGDFDMGILADQSMAKDELLADLNSCYSSEQQARYGALGIRIELAR